MFLVKSDCEKLFVQVIDILQIDYFYHMWFYMSGSVYKTTANDVQSALQ